MARQIVDITTVQANGKRGEPAPSAFAKLNANDGELYALIGAGGVLESGSTSNGNYIKFADGTLICSGISPGALTTSTQGGSVFHSASVTFTFPVPFAGNVPRIMPGVLTTTNYYSWAATEGGVSANLTDTTMRLVAPVNGATGYICYTAIGRWK